MGERIRAQRKARGLSLPELASLTDTDKGYLSRIECGHLEPTLKKLRRIAKELGVETAVLVGGVSAASEKRSA